MRIQHNISALNASNKLKINDNAIQKNIAKLSSGYRINSAADDAAGLAVSEKMRAQIGGLDQAQDNTKNGISLIQTAEGGLNETSAILQRMNVLATESANGTYQNGTDRVNLQKEVDALKSEVDRISTSTNFNQISLLDGSLDGGISGGDKVSALLQFTPNSVVVTDENATAGIYKVTTPVAGSYAPAVATGDKVDYNITYKDAAGTTQSRNISISYDKDAKKYIADNGTEYSTTAAASNADWDVALTKALKGDSVLSAAFKITDAAGTKTFTANDKGTAAPTLVGISATQTMMASPSSPTALGTSAVDVSTSPADAYKDVDTFVAYDGTADTAKQAVFSVNGQKFAFVSTGVNASSLGKDVNIVYTAGTTPVAAEATGMSNLINAKTGLGTTVSGTAIDFKAGAAAGGETNALAFQVGADNKADQRVSLSIKDMSSKGLGIASLNINDQGNARNSIDVVKAAINTVNATRADLGALQNELEHTANNLSVMSENLNSAESTIRDVDMSSEYVQYSKNQILSQAANAMLAQANAQPQSVLSLIKG